MRHVVQALSALAMIAAATGAAHGQNPSSEEIVKALLPNGAQTRSLRGVTIEPGQEEPTPSIDLQVNFAYDSADLTNEALITLKALGEALQDARLQGSNFMIVGHTDAKGSDAYNMTLSEKRALAVRNHLAFFYGVEAARLASIGRGESQLAYPSDPENELNRRVEIRNVKP